MYVYIYVCIYIYMYVYIYIFIYVRICLHVIFICIGLNAERQLVTCDELVQVQVKCSTAAHM